MWGERGRGRRHAGTLATTEDEIIVCKEAIGGLGDGFRGKGEANTYRGSSPRRERKEGGRWERLVGYMWKRQRVQGRE